MDFKIIKTNEIKTAWSIILEDGKYVVTFEEKGKKYFYSEQTIEVLEELEKNIKTRLIVYKLDNICYRCGEKTEILTYIVFSGTNENVSFPWDKSRLNKNQIIEMHLQDPSIEYYGLEILGQNSNLDKILADKYNDRIKLKYSNKIKKTYHMNVCKKCGAHKGANFIYRDVNEMIAKGNRIEIKEIIELTIK